jgi:hypothetical protein
MILHCDTCTRTCLLDLELPEGKKFGVFPGSDHLPDEEWLKQYDEWCRTEGPHWDFLKTQGWSRKVVNWKERICCPDCSISSSEKAKAKIDKILQRYKTADLKALLDDSPEAQAQAVKEMFSDIPEK